MPRFPIFFPHLPDAPGYVVNKADAAGTTGTPAVPPRHTWISEKYGDTPEQYLASGKRDIDDMLTILRRADVQIERLGNILEFGCGDGRMIRFLDDLTRTREIWGTDINATRVIWCKQHLSPPFHFLTTTTIPYLPFEDRHFGFIYAGSVFTHIDDLADAWLAELRRLLRPGGYLFITVHLKNDLHVLRDKHPNSGLAKMVRQHPDFTASDFDMFTIGRAAESYVFYDLAYLRKSLEPMFRLVSITEEVRLYQNGLLLTRV
jgi:SAM-dependent methyltransferase